MTHDESPVSITFTWRPYHISNKSIIGFIISVLLYGLLLIIMLGALNLGDYYSSVFRNLFGWMFGADHEIDFYIFSMIIYAIIIFIPMIALTEIFFGRQIRRQKRERRAMRQHSV